MSTAITIPAKQAVVPAIPISIRVATLADLPFIDGLQKQHSKQLGYFPTKQFEEYIGRGEMLVADAVVSCQLPVASEEPAVGTLTGNWQLPTGNSPLGYVIARDRYLKRDELGVIYQLCVAPVRQRGLIGASLIRDVFARSAYGCRLYCCWCAQDIEANRFWESLGFVPIAFRAGSSGKKRVHIFWQRRICQGDESTPYWYPFQTNSGAIREDRLVFPIPPGTHWKEVQAVALPGRASDEKRDEPRALPHPKSAIRNPASSPTTPRAVQFGRPETAVVTAAPRSEARGPKPELTANPPATAPKPTPKIDPAFVAAARELRDRWLERVNADPSALPAQGKYDVGRGLPGPSPAPACLAGGAVPIRSLDVNLRKAG